MKKKIIFIIFLSLSYSQTTMILNTKFTNYFLYINQINFGIINTNKYIYKNLDKGRNLILLLQKDSFCYKTVYNRNFDNLNIIFNNLITPQKTKYKILFTGFIPGANYFLHFPDSGSGYIFPLFFFFYSALTLGIISDLNIIEVSRDISGYTKAQGKNYYIAAGIFSLFHALFSYSGYIQDMENIQKRYVGKIIIKF